VSITVLIANVLCNSFTCGLVPAVEMKTFGEWFRLIMLLEGFHQGIVCLVVVARVGCIVMCTFHQSR